MKTIILTLLCALLWVGTTQAQESAISRFYQKYENDETFTVVYVSQHMFGLFAELDLEEVEDEVILDILKDLTGLHILVTEENAMKRYQEALGMIKDPAYEVLMKVREESTHVQFFVKRNQADIEELLLLVQEDDDEFVLISIVGKIDLAKISNLAKIMEIEGLDYLEHVKEDY